MSRRGNEGRYTKRSTIAQSGQDMDALKKTRSIVAPSHQSQTAEAYMYPIAWFFYRPISTQLLSKGGSLPSASATPARASHESATFQAR
jgi:hypothetical protein